MRPKLNHTIMVKSEKNSFWGYESGCYNHTATGAPDRWVDRWILRRTTTPDECNK